MIKVEKRIEQIAGIGIAILLIIGCFFILRPFLSALTWAAIVCFSTWPIYHRVECVLKGKRTLAAMMMTFLVILVVIIPLTALGFSLADNAKEAFRSVDKLLNEGVPDLPAWVDRVPLVGNTIQNYWSEIAQEKKKPIDNKEKEKLIEDKEKSIKDKEEVAESRGKVIEKLKGFLGPWKGWFFALGKGVGHGIFQLCLSVFICFFFYRDGAMVVEKLHEAIKRIVGDRTQHLLGIITGTVKGVVYGILGTALAQGILAWIGLWIAGVPFPLVWGVTTFFLSLIPAGPPLVWVPATIWLIFHKDAIGRGIFLGIWGMFGISGIDNILKPYLISRESKLPFILVFLGILGGIITFGFTGIFIGPTLLAVGYSLVQEWSSSKISNPFSKNS